MVMAAPDMLALLSLIEAPLVMLIGEPFSV
jgi:hypothetical protein